MSYEIPSLQALSGGAYRNVFMFKTDIDRAHTLKVARSILDYATRDYEFMRSEGAVSAAVAPHPLIIDIYGFCALSQFNEGMVRGDAERAAIPDYKRQECQLAPSLDNGPEVERMNMLSPTRKLVWALDMVEAVALLHNHHRGLIIHDDIQLSQFMIANDGSLKMGDFNRAEVSGQWKTQELERLAPNSGVSVNG